MKRGSEYAKRIKQLYQQMIRKFGKPELPEPTDPIHQLIVGILSENTAEHKGAALFQRIREQMVDLNELRVTPPMELAEMIGTTVPQARDKAERIIHVLNEIRARQDALDLSFLKQRGRREAREFLESLEGVGLSAAASVVVHSLGGHAIPVDFLTIYVLRKEEHIDDTAGPGEVQSFLERNVPAADGRMFVSLLNRHVVTEGARVSVSKLPDLLNLEPPPLPKPRKNIMAVPPPRPDDGVPSIDALDPDDGILAEVEVDLVLDPEVVEQETESKPNSSPPSKKSKKGSAAEPAAKKSSPKPAKSKTAEPSPKKKKG